MRIVILGAEGQLGSAISHTCRGAHQVIALSRHDLDIVDPGAVERTLARLRPNAVVNCAAYNAVDAAEDNEREAFETNAFGVRGLARAVASCRAALVHYSTDFVFDGTSSTPYREEDSTNPRSVYAISKQVGEWFALDYPEAYVLRVESLFGRAPDGRARGSIHGVFAALQDGRSSKVFIDRTVSPTYVPDAAEATLKLLELRPRPGLYHCVNTGACTWYELFTELARVAGLPPRLEPVRVADVPLRAHRPQYSALSNEKLASVGIRMPGWRDAISRFAATYALAPGWNSEGRFPSLMGLGNLAAP